MRKIILHPGSVGDYDGGYDWVRVGQEDLPEHTLGYHVSAWPGESYFVYEVETAL